MKHWRQIFERETYRREIIKYDIDLYSPMDPVSLATKLKAEMELSKKRTGRQVFGFGTEKKMNLIHAKRKGSKGFAPQLAATMSEYEGGTLIQANVRQYLKEIPFFVLWCAFVGFFFLGSLPFWFIDVIPTTVNLIISGIPLLMIAMVVWLDWGKAEPRPPKDIGSPQIIIDWLEATVSARVIDDLKSFKAGGSDQ